MFTKTVAWACFGAAGSILLSACASPAPDAGNVERIIYMAAVEPKGGATTRQEPYPQTELPQGGGYVLNKPDKNDRWEVSTYRWEPGTVVVYQGDKVTLEIIGINGAAHPLRIEGHDVKAMVRRGEITRVSFVAAKAGIFKIICDAHQPSMQADLVVLPRR